ncbi:YciI family protein [uncultured Tateyamaria sp.]|uniref:YciI family protein n=1 Tax=uncultured Tateyamaria sp. TaxID=455651 RepID=UPI0026150460|nr:YciI family protein [uncultured Tateyamaria sp.]
MPDWDKYKAEAKARGALALELYVIKSTPRDMSLVKETLPDHLAYQKKLEAEGVLFLAGPVSDKTGIAMDAEGMMIYRAPDFETAHELAINDPMHLSGARDYEIRKWLINEGSVSLSVSLSGQAAHFK